MENSNDNIAITKRLQNETYTVKDKWGFSEDFYIPKFNGTKHALEFGEKWHNDPKAIELLTKERARLLDNVKALREMGREDEAFYLASGQSQLVREALEEATKKDDKK